MDGTKQMEAWLEGFAEKAAECGVPAEDIPQLVKLAKQLELSGRPEFQEGYSEAMEKSGQAFPDPFMLPKMFLMMRGATGMGPGDIGRGGMSPDQLLALGKRDKEDPGTLARIAIRHSARPTDVSMNGPDPQTKRRIGVVHRRVPMRTPVGSRARRRRGDNHAGLQPYHRSPRQSLHRGGLDL